jgi:AbrB family looped-hinge helix DNA binding protein
MSENGIIRIMDIRGRIVVPADARKRLGVARGDPVEVHVGRKDITIRKHAAPGAAKSIGGAS